MAYLRACKGASSASGYRTPKNDKVSLERLKMPNRGLLK